MTMLVRLLVIALILDVIGALVIVTVLWPFFGANTWLVAGPAGIVFGLAAGRWVVKRFGADD